MASDGEYFTGSTVNFIGMFQSNFFQWGSLLAAEEMSYSIPARIYTIVDLLSVYAACFDHRPPPLVLSIRYVCVLLLLVQVSGSSTLRSRCSSTWERLKMACSIG
jgi:hypothetical protein